MNKSRLRFLISACLVFTTIFEVFADESSSSSSSSEELSSGELKELQKKVKNMIRDISQDCKEKEKATDDDIEDMLSHKKTSSRPSKCTRKCLMEMFNLISSEGRLSTQGFKDLIEILPIRNEGILTDLEEIVKTCSGVSHKDPCEAAFMIDTCMKDEAVAKNLYFDD